MKIAIITFHDTFNFGATLQCAALFRYLSSQGHCVLVINYMPEYVRRKKSAGRLFSGLKEIIGFVPKCKAFFKAISYFSHVFSFHRRNVLYQDFLSRHVERTDVISDPRSIGAINADFYICGSDQIWNPNLTGGDFDSAFFLNPVSGRKAAYGVSTGETDLFAYSDRLRELTSEFESISARESKTAGELSSILNRKIETVLDPSLLLDEEDYREMESAIPDEEPYVLVYTVSPAPAANAGALKIAADKGWKILDISPHPFIKIPGAKKIDHIGPGEFLTYIKQAEFIITNSYHGTVFSILYKKYFFSFPNRKRSGRTIELLRTLGLRDRLTKYAEFITYEMINYDKVFEKLDQARKSSYAYLHQSICLRTSSANNPSSSNLSS